MKKIWVAFVLFLFLSISAIAQPRETEARPTDDGIFNTYRDSSGTADFESNIKSSISRMQNEDCRKGHSIRILFYGQSITEQGWWKRLVEYWTLTYPTVKFEIENKAIGGHAADMLLKTAEADVYRFNPDLIIFHVYGSHTAYETIIQNIRERTTAEIIIATDHITNDSHISEETSYWKLVLWRNTRWLTWLWKDKPQYQWDAWMNYAFLPKLAERYKLELVDMRSEWKKYLLQYGLKAKQLLIDEVHLNANGEYLMASVMTSHFSKIHALSKDCNNPKIIENKLDKNSLVGTESFKIDINGSRMELNLNNESSSAISIYVDGIPPSQHIDHYGFSRSSSYPGTPWPALLQVHRGPGLPKQEVWEACIDPHAMDSDWYAFEIHGSKTGADGSGQTNKHFVSNSSQIIIEPGDWNLNYAEKVWGKRIDKKTCFTWDSLSPGADSISNHNQTAKELLAFTGLSNNEHIVELKGKDLSSIHSLRIFRPPLKCIGYYSYKYCYFNQ